MQCVNVHKTVFLLFVCGINQIRSIPPSLKMKNSKGSDKSGRVIEFDATEFEKRLTNLKDTQESIQAMSAWCLQNRSHHKKIVGSWLIVLKQGKTKLCFFGQLKRWHHISMPRIIFFMFLYYFCWDFLDWFYWILNIFLGSSQSWASLDIVLSSEWRDPK